MRKKVLMIVSILLLAASLAVGLSACNNKKSQEEKANISRQTDAMYVGEDSVFAVTVETGKREKPFIADGKANNVSAFTEITVVPLVKNEFETITFKLEAEGKSLDGTLNSNSFGEFSAEAELNFVPSMITVSAGDKTSSIELNNVLQDSLSSSDVINIAKKEFADRIQKEAGGGELKREIYVKLITGDRAKYYYYVSFIGEGVDYWAMLVDPKTGDIISKK